LLNQVGVNNFKWEFAVLYLNLKNIFPIPKIQLFDIGFCEPSLLETIA